MNGKISLSVLTAFAIVILMFIVLYNYTDLPKFEPHDKNHPFYTQEFDPVKKKIFILGSSHLTSINATLVDDLISKKHDNYVVYNLAINSDTPLRRFNTLQPIISLEPEIVVYGVNIRDFHAPYDLSILPDTKKMLEDMLYSANPSLSLINPKLFSRTVIISFFSDSWNVKDFFSNNTKLSVANSPFFLLPENYTKIATEDELKNKAPEELMYKTKWQVGDLSSDNQQLFFFKEMIKTFKENNVKVVLFATPLSKDFLEILPDPEEKNLDTILQDLSEEFDVKIYDLTYKYTDLAIWADPTHITFAETGTIFSNDIAEIISLEIDS